MPSERSLKAKQQFVSELVDKIKSSNVGILVSYKGINVENDTKLRREMREAGVNYFVVKNTMLRFASKEVGYDFDEKLTGTTALALSPEDPVSVAKILTKYSKELGENTEFAIKIGFLDGKIIDVDTIVEIGSLPSKEQLIGQLLSVLVAPIRGLAVALNAVAEKDPKDTVAEKSSDVKNSVDAKTDEKVDNENVADVKVDVKVDSEKTANVKADTDKGADAKTDKKVDVEKATNDKTDVKTDTEKVADVKVDKKVHAKKTTDAKNNEKVNAKKVADTKSDKKSDAEKDTDVKADKKVGVDKVADAKANKKVGTEKTIKVKKSTTTKSAASETEKSEKKPKAAAKKPAAKTTSSDSSAKKTTKSKTTDKAEKEASKS